MSSFNVLVKEIIIEEHPKADRIELARVDGYTCCVEKGIYKTGDLAAYIPDQSILPDDIVQELGLENILQKNKVRVIKLRGMLSLGLLYPINGNRLNNKKYSIGDDVTEILQITKYIPEVPVSLRGSCSPFSGQKYYDIENIKNFPNVLQTGENIVITEKISGAICRITRSEGEIRISSRGLGNNGLAFKPDGKTVYHCIVEHFKGDFNEIDKRLGDGVVDNHNIFCVIFGKDIHSLGYNTTLDIRVCDIHNGTKWLNVKEVLDILKGLQLQYVPILYRDKYHPDIIDKHAIGSTLVNTDENSPKPHIREGIVIRPETEREDDVLGRVILKSISPDYLIGGGGNKDE